MKMKELLKAQPQKVRTLNKESTIREAIPFLFKEGINAVLITDNQNKLCGLVTERDIVRAMGDFGRETAEKPVKDIMSIDLVVCGPDTLPQEALQLMSKNKIRNLPVVDGAHLLGVVGVVEVVQAMME